MDPDVYRKQCEIDNIQTLNVRLIKMKNEIYPDQFSELISICRSHLNGVITEKTSKKEKQKYGFMALEKLNDIEAVYHGLTPVSEVPHA